MHDCSEKENKKREERLHLCGGSYCLFLAQAAKGRKEKNHESIATALPWFSAVANYRNGKNNAPNLVDYSSLWLN